MGKCSAGNFENYIIRNAISRCSFVWNHQSFVLNNWKKKYSVNSLVSGHRLKNWKKKCPLLELSAYENYFYRRTTTKNRVDVRLRESLLAGFHYVLLGSKKGKISGRQMEIGQNQSPLLLCCFVKDLLQIKDKFIAKSQLLYMGCPLTREHKQKKNPIFLFKSVLRPLARECPLTGICKYKEFALTDLS